MKKRMLTLLLVVCMVFGCLTPAASAVGDRLVNAAQAVGEGTSETGLRNDSAKNVVTGEESVADDAAINASESDDPVTPFEADTEQTTGWLVELIEASVDLTSAKSCEDELAELASQYEPNEHVSAFVVLADEPLADTYSSKRKVPTDVLEGYEKKQQAVIEAITETVDSVEIVKQFNFLTNSIVIETEFANLGAIARLDGVASVFISPVFYPATADVDPLTVSSGQMTNVDDVWNLNGTGFTGTGMTIAILDTGLDLDHPSFAADPEMNEDSWTKESVRMLLDETEGLNAAEEYNGTLTADYVYYSAKVPFHFNYALGNNSVSHNDTLGDHGTHVAGIAAANEVEGTGVVGMAPDAQIIAMKVFNSTTGGANLYDYVAALEDCILLGVDVANLSLGSAAGFGVTGYAEVDAIFDRIAGTGLIVNIAAGNDGTSANGSLYGEQMALTSTIDNSSVASPSTYDNVMSIASVDNAYVMADYFLLDDGTKVFYQACMEYLYGYTEIGIQELFAGQTLQYVIVDGAGEAEDFYDADGYSIVDGKVAVIKRGTINFSTKIANAEAAGASAAIVWNNVSEDIYSFGMSVEDTETGAYPGIPALFVSLEDGQLMADDETKNITVTGDAALRVNTTGGQISSFSSWGASSDLRLLPDLSGIGGNVYSCYDGGKYGLMSGTSMATPQVSGVSAIVKQYLKTKNVTDNETVEALMMSTAKVIIDDESGVETSPRQQGAGLVDALRAVTSGAYLTVDGGRPKAELGDGTDGSFTFNFEIHNFGTESKTYTLSASLLCEDYVESDYYDGVTYMAGYDTTLDGMVRFSSDSVTVAAGETATVTVTVSVSAEGVKWIRDHFENGNYVEGYVYLTDTAEEGGVDLSLPFMGFCGDWADAPIFDQGYWYNNSFWTSSLSGVNGDVSGEEYWNVLWLNMGVSDNDWLLGVNPYSGALVDEEGNVIYSEENNVLTPNGDGVMDNISDYYLSLLRNARYVWLTYTDEEGNVLDRQTLEYESKTMYYSSYGYTVPFVYSWYYNMDDLYDFTDADGNYLPDGTKVTLTLSAVIDYHVDEKVEIVDGKVIPVAVDDSISIPITIDTSAPVMDTDNIVETQDADGNRYLTFTFTEAHPATAALMNPSGTQLYDQVFDNEMVKNADGTWSVTLDITARGDDFMVVFGDYGYNESYYQVSRAEVGGNNPVMDTSALYAYQVYNQYIYTYYGWDYMFGWSTVDTDEGTVTMVNSDAYEYYAINAAEYVDGYVFAVDAGCNFLYMTPGLWNRTTIRHLDYNIIDMAFDDTTGTMYVAISDSAAYTYALGTIDLMSGELTILRDYGSKYNMPWAMTFVEGELYCCKYYYTGLYHVDLETYEIDNVTDADGNPYYPTTSSGANTSPYYGQSMTYSKADGKIYWLYCNSNSYSELIAIDPTTWTNEAISLGSAEYVGVLTLEDTEYQIPEATEVTGLLLRDSEKLIAKGKSEELACYPVPWNASQVEIVWTSENESIATVRDGVITGVSEGTTVITAACGGATATCEVTVIDVSGTLYGFDYSADGTYGSWQKIDLATMVPTDTVSNDVAFMAASYNGHDGYVYGYDSDSFRAWKMNSETGELTSLAGVGYDDTLGYVADMAYDYSTGIMYAIMSASTSLYAMNMHTGKLVAVADSEWYTFATLACDLEGNLFAMDTAGTLYQLSLYETTDEGDDSGIGGWEPLMRELDRRDLDDDMNVGYEDEETATKLAVEVNYVMELDVSTYGYVYYGQSMCYDYANDVILWCYTDGNTFRWIDLYEGYVYDLGSTTTHSMPQYLGLYTVPEEMPELEPIYVEEISVDDMFLLIGGSAEPSMEAEPINVNCAYVPYYDIAISYADDGTDDPVIEVVDGRIVALKAGTAYVNAYAVTEDFEDCFAETYFRVTVKNATNSDILMFSGDNLCWFDVDQFNTENPTFNGYVYYDEAYNFLYSAEYVAADDVIYAYGYDANSWDATIHFMTIDPATMTITDTIDMGAGYPFVYDMEFDYNSGTMYALAGTSDVVALYYVNLSTGELIQACALDDMYLSMTVDAEGTIYLMSRSEYDYVDWDYVQISAKLYTVDETTGEVEFVLDTGVYNPYVTSLGYDYDTGYLYWTPYDQGLYLIDLNDLSVNQVGDMEGQRNCLLLLAKDYPEIPDYLVDAVMLTPTVDLTPGAEADLELFTKPATVDTTVTWFSGDESIATVDENGRVTGVSVGITAIYALVTDGTNYVVSTAKAYVYGDNEYFLSYNATDNGFTAIDRQDPTLVTNLTEGETDPAVTAMVMQENVIYAYDEAGNFFTAASEDDFVRTYLGSCGIDVDEYSYVESSDFAIETYTATFTVRDMTILDGKILALGAIAYNVHSAYLWDGEVYYEYDWMTEAYGGCCLYEVDIETGALSLLCEIYAEDGDYMSGAKMLTADANGKLYLYTYYNDIVYVLDPAAGTTTSVANFQNLGVYGDEASVMSMDYDALSDSIYMLMTTNGTYYRLFKMPVETCAIAEVGNVGEVTYEDWSYNGDLFHGMIVISDMHQPEHIHNYVVEKTISCTEDGRIVVACACGDILFEKTIDAMGHSWNDGEVTTAATCTTDGVMTYVCVACGETKTEAIPAIGHSYTDVVTAPTCTEKGYTTHTCAVCGEILVDSYVDALGHNYVNGVCTNCGDGTYDCYFKTFSDCKEEWYHEAVDFAVANGLMKGVGKGKFEPDEAMTRAMIVTVLYRAAGSPAVTTATTFSDVPSGEWYTDAIAWAQANSIVKGVSKTEFAPEENVTREQIVTILWRYAGEPEAKADLSSFKDSAKVSDYAVDAMNWAVQQGILIGDEGNLKPTDSATRAEFACIIMRFLGGSYACG